MNQEESPSRGKNGASAGKALALMDIGLGLAQLAAPEPIGRTVGLPAGDGGRLALRLIGARQVAMGGATLFLRRRGSAWLWARFASDLLDIGLLTWAWRQQSSHRWWSRSKRSLGLPSALSAMTARAVVDGVRAVRATRQSRQAEEPEPRNAVERPSLAITIGRERSAVSAFFRDPSNLARYVSYLQNVSVLSDGRAAVQVKGPAGGVMRFVAGVALAEQGDALTWTVSTGSGEPLGGVSLRLKDAPKDRGTEVRLELDAADKRGLGRIVGSLLRLWTREKVRNDLRRAKQILELGEPARSDASVHAGPHAARPPRRREASGTRNGSARLGGLT
jgi:uncharacterized membrane protein